MTISKPQSAETFLTETLPNGVQVVGQPMEGVQSAALGFLVGTGACDEKDSELGISYFTLEMLFRGTQKYDARELSERLDSLGISYGSSPSLETSMVSAVLLGDKLPSAIELLAEIVRAPSFPDDAIDQVRALLLQELRQRDDQPPQKVFDEVRKQFFDGSPASHDVLGTQETVESLSRDDLAAYWDRRYTANNILISVAGNFEWDRTIEQVRSLTAAWPEGEGRRSMPLPQPHSALHTLVEEKTQEHLGFAFPCVAVGHPDYYAAALMSHALGGSSTSRLFQEVREKRGLAYAVQSRFDAYQNAGLIRIYAGTSADRAHESVEIILAELEKLERDGISQEELDRAKVRLRSSVIMRNESTGARMMANARTWWYERKLRSLEQTREEIDRVTVDDVRRLAGQLGMTDTLAIVALGPRSQGELFAATSRG